MIAGLASSRLFAMFRVFESLLNELDPASDGPYCLALSGGLDSTVLLHGLSRLRERTSGMALRAVHINHQLHADASVWATHCEALCRDLGVPLHTERVIVDSESGHGMEAAARRARYEVFSRILQPDETLLTAHHRDDQVETVLFRLIRGAGVHGLAGIPARARFARGWLRRPLLDMSRAEIESDAREHGIAWMEDPGNTDTGMDRNFLRQRIMPELVRRWPATAITVGRSARLHAEAAHLLDDLARIDAANLVVGQSIDLAGLRQLEPARQRNMIRYVARSIGLSAPSEIQLKTGLNQLLDARQDAHPRLRWRDAQLRRYRKHLYFIGFDPELLFDSRSDEYTWDGVEVLHLGDERGRLRFAVSDSGGISMSYQGPLRVRFRRGGEQIMEKDQQHHKRLKKLFQESGIFPWMRSHIPLIYAGERLLAVGDLWISGECRAAAGEQGLSVVWEDHALIR